MNIAQIDTDITFNTGASISEFTAADRLIKINNVIDDLHIQILQSQDGADFDDKNYTDSFPVETTDLVADQADYAMPAEMVKEKRLKISYDGTNWYKLTPFDINKVGVALKNDYFSVQAPYYDLHDNSIEIYPTPTENVTAGLQIWISRQMALYTSAEVTTGTKSPGFDRQFHKLVPLKVSWEWIFFKVKDYAKADRLKLEIEKLELKLKQHYSDKQRDGNINARAEYVNYE